MNKTFFLNGHEFLVRKNLTLSEIIFYFNYQNYLYIVEYNNLICNPEKYNKIKINFNDKIELISIVGGG